MGMLRVYRGLSEVSRVGNYTVTFKQEAGMEEAHGPILDAWAQRMLGVVRESNEIRRADGRGVDRVKETDDAFKARMRRMLVSQWRVLADRDVLAKDSTMENFSQIKARQLRMTEAEILGEVAKCRPVLDVVLENEKAIGWRRVTSRLATDAEVKDAICGTLPEGYSVDPRALETGHGGEPRPVYAQMVTRIGPRQWIMDCIKAGVEPKDILGVIGGWRAENLTCEVWEHGPEWEEVCKLHGSLQIAETSANIVKRMARPLPCVLCGDHYAPLDRLQPFQFCLQCGGDLYFVGEDLEEAEAKHAEIRGIRLERLKNGPAEKISLTARAV
jgi:hypothetical protein